MTTYTWTIESLYTQTIANEADYAKILENDTLSITDLSSIAPGKQLTLELTHENGAVETIKLNHTYNDQQIDWYKAGSALNLIKLQEA
jgi:aconitate hydratase